MLNIASLDVDCWWLMLNLAFLDVGCWWLKVRLRIWGGIGLCHSPPRLLKCREMKIRRARIRRVTRETRIEVALSIDGVGKASVQTGIPFFDHMLELLAK